MLGCFLITLLLQFLAAAGITFLFIFYSCSLCVFLILCTLSASLGIKDGEGCRIQYKKGRKGLSEDLFKRKISASKGETPRIR